MTGEERLGLARALIAEHQQAPEDDHAPLALESLVLVLVAEGLEARAGIRVAARDVVPENFGSIARIAAYLAKRGA